MAGTANKGEWSELFVLAKALICPNIPYQDGTIKTIETIQRPEIGGYITYIPYDGKVITCNGNKIMIDVFEYQKYLEELLNDIKKNKKIKGKGIASSAGMYFLNLFQTSCVKASSNNNDDILFKFKGEKAWFGLNIKSELAALSSLFNADEDKTNLVYIITKNNLPFNLHQKYITKLNEQGPRTLVPSLLKDGYDLKHFPELEDEEIGRLLLDKKIVNSRLIISEQTKAYYSTPPRTGKTTIQALISKCYSSLAKEYKIRPADVDDNAKDILEKWYNGEHKKSSKNSAAVVKNYSFLGNCNLKKNGDLLIQECGAKNGLSNFLFENVVQDTPSSKRHHCGKILQGKKHGGSIIKLGLLFKIKKNKTFVE